MARKLSKQVSSLPPPTDNSISSYRMALRDVFDKLSTEDLWTMAKCLVRLNLVGFCLSYCLEILEDRGVLPGQFNDLMGN